MRLLAGWFWNSRPKRTRNAFLRGARTPHRWTCLRNNLSLRPFFQAPAHVDILRTFIDCNRLGINGSNCRNFAMSHQNHQPWHNYAIRKMAPECGVHFLMKHILQHSAPYRLPCFQGSKSEKVLTCFQMISLSNIYIYTCIYTHNM